MTDQLTPTPQIVPVQVEIKGSNGLAVAGFVLALLGALISFMPIVNIFGDLLAVLGLVFGVIGLVKSGKSAAGKGLSIATIILAVVAFAVSIAVNTATVAAVNTAVKTLPAASAAPAAPAAPTAPAVHAKTSAKVGDTITLSGSAAGSKADVTVMKVVDPTNSTDGFSKPVAGSRYVTVQFQIQNTGTVAYSDSPSNGAKVADVSGQEFDSKIVGSVSAGPMSPASVKLPAGDKALGYLVFEVPTTSKLAAVQFSMDSGFGNSGHWTVK